MLLLIQRTREEQLLGINEIGCLPQTDVITNVIIILMIVSGGNTTSSTLRKYSNA